MHTKMWKLCIWVTLESTFANTKPKVNIVFLWKFEQKTKMIKFRDMSMLATSQQVRPSGDCMDMKSCRAITRSTNQTVSA